MTTELYTIDRKVGPILPMTMNPDGSFKWGIDTFRFDSEAGGTMSGPWAGSIRHGTFTVSGNSLYTYWGDGSAGAHLKYVPEGVLLHYGQGDGREKLLWVYLTPIGFDNPAARLLAQDLEAAKRQSHTPASAIISVEVGNPVTGLPGAIWADRNGDNRPDGYIKDGEYVPGAALVPGVEGKIVQLQWQNDNLCTSAMQQKYPKSVSACAAIRQQLEQITGRQAGNPDLLPTLRAEELQARHLREERAQRQQEAQRDAANEQAAMQQRMQMEMQMHQQIQGAIGQAIARGGGTPPQMINPYGTNVGAFGVRSSAPMPLDSTSRGNSGASLGGSGTSPSQSASQRPIPPQLYAVDVYGGIKNASKGIFGCQFGAQDEAFAVVYDVVSADDLRRAAQRGVDEALRFGYRDLNLHKDVMQNADRFFNACTQATNAPNKTVRLR
jgi:hypothetical protein